MTNNERVVLSDWKHSLLLAFYQTRLRQAIGIKAVEAVEKEIPGAYPHLFWHEVQCPKTGKVTQEPAYKKYTDAWKAERQERLDDLKLRAIGVIA